MNNDEPVRIALVGCGRISQIHLTAIRNHPTVELVAVADADTAAAKDAAEAWGGSFFDDAVELLEQVRPGAVILCTPPDTHRELTVAALKAGAHVLCEKPLACNVDDATDMHEAADRAGRVLMMASKFRYVHDMVLARSILQSGVIGEVLSFENEFCSFVDMGRRWNSRQEMSGGGVLIDNGTHSVDIVRYLLGPIVDVYAIEGRRWQPLDVEDTCRLFCRVEQEVVAAIELSWTLQKQSPWFVSVYGADGALQVGWQQSRYRHGAKSDWIPFGSGYDKFDATVRQLDDFVQCIRGQRSPLIAPDSAMASVRVIQAAYRSLRGGCWEAVES